MALGALAEEKRLGRGRALGQLDPVKREDLAKPPFRGAPVSGYAGGHPILNGPLLRRRAVFISKGNLGRSRKRAARFVTG